MGKSTTPSFRIELQTPDGWEHFAWDTKKYGKPTPDNAKKFRDGMNDSFKRGGVNHHVSVALGVQKHYCNAKIVRQITGQVVAMFKSPSFEIID